MRCGYGPLRTRFRRKETRRTFASTSRPLASSNGLPSFRRARGVLKKKAFLCSRQIFSVPLPDRAAGLDVHRQVRNHPNQTDPARPTPSRRATSTREASRACAPTAGFKACVLSSLPSFPTFLLAKSLALVSSSDRPLSSGSQERAKTLRQPSPLLSDLQKKKWHSEPTPTPTPTKAASLPSSLEMLPPPDADGPLVRFLGPLAKRCASLTSPVLYSLV